MKLDLLNLGGTTIRARVAFALAVADYALSFHQDSECVKLARESIDAGWEWEQSLTVPPDDLYGYLEREEEDGGGLIFEAAKAQADCPREYPGLMAAASAIAYVTWHAYLHAREKHLPETIAEVTEEILADLVRFVEQAPGYDPAFVEHVTQYCLAQHGTEDPSELGSPISREVLVRVAPPQPE